MKCQGQIGQNMAYENGTRSTLNEIPGKNCDNLRNKISDIDI